MNSDQNTPPGTSTRPSLDIDLLLLPAVFGLPTASGIPTVLDEAFPLTIISGHYGVGKTNLALNLIAHWQNSMQSFTLIDLDVVNPYFRSSDMIGWLIDRSVSLLGPSLARSTLDTPALSPGIDNAIYHADSKHPVIIDVGGDPDGARALARYSNSINTRNHHLIHVANFNRPEVARAESSLQMLRDIEAQSGLKTTSIIGNSHLKEQSTVDQIVSTLPTLFALSLASGVPLLAITAPWDLADHLKAILDSIELPHDFGLPILPVRQLVTTPWENND